MSTKISATDVNNLTDEQKDSLAKTVGALDVLRQLNNDTITKMEAIDRQLTYRRFYFPGTTIKLKIEVSDANKYDDTSEIEYVEEQWDSSVFDPRYIKSYIEMARQYGFEKHVIRPEENSFKEASFADIKRILDDHIDLYNDDNTYRYLFYNPSATSNEKEKIKSRVLGAFAAMSYFNKWEAFYKQYRDDIEKSDIQMISEFYKKQINKEIYKIEDLVGQSIEEFIENDYGFLAPIQYAFDAAQYISEYNKYEQEYIEYRDKLWDILSKCDAISIAGNRISGTFVATGGSNINLTQMNELEQSLREAQTAIEQAPTTEPSNEAKSEPSNEAKSEPSNEAKSERSSTDEAKSEPSKTDETKPSSIQPVNNVPKIDSINQEPKKEESFFEKHKIAIIISIISFITLIIVNLKRKPVVIAPQGV